MSVEEIVSVDGTITPTAEAVIPLKDDGLYRGDGVFEVVRLYGGRPFAMEEHLDRIERSAAQIELPVDRAAVERESSALLEAHGDGDAQLRIVLTRGGRRIAAIEPIPDLAPSVSLATRHATRRRSSSRARRRSPTARTCRRPASPPAQGADEAVLVRPDGVVLEPPTSTIFWATESGGLRTPALDAGILDSITRRKLLEVLDDVEEGEFQLDDLLGATRGVPGLVRARGPAGRQHRRHGARPARQPDAAGARGVRRPDLRLARVGRLSVGPRPHRRAAADRRDGARLHRQRDRPAGPRERPGAASSTPSWRAGSARWATSAPRSPRSTAAAAWTTSPTA